MKILSYLNVSNIDNIESDSGYIFNYLLYKNLKIQKSIFKIVLPEKLKSIQKQFEKEDTYYVQMGETKYETRYLFDWSGFLKCVSQFEPDVIFLNQAELATTVRVLLNSNGLYRIKIFVYCHYPALHVNDREDIIIDYSLNDYGVGENIVTNILCAINVADKFVIQSEFAKSLLIKYANKHSFEIQRDIITIAPPYDPYMYVSRISSPVCHRILYNHRLYDSYGTKQFINFVKNNPDLNFIVADPMTNRNNRRMQYNSSPRANRETLNQLYNVEVVDGGKRDTYAKTIESCRLAIAPQRKACVWSMSVIDCFCRGIPVIAPNIAVFGEMIPSELLFDSEIEERHLIDKLNENDDFWMDSSEKCRKILAKISPQVLAQRLFEV